jgi:NitT/TauT family transport system ATP-binding protein
VSLGGLLPLVDAAVMLGLARVDGPRIAITDEGRELSGADILTSKQLFARSAAHRAPLVRAIVQALAATDDHTLREGFFLDRRPSRSGHASSRCSWARSRTVRG